MGPLIEVAPRVAFVSLSGLQPCWSWSRHPRLSRSGSSAQSTPLAVVMLNSFDDPAVIAELEARRRAAQRRSSPGKKRFGTKPTPPRGPSSAEGNAARTGDGRRHSRKRSPRSSTSGPNPTSLAAERAAHSAFWKGRSQRHNIPPRQRHPDDSEPVSRTRCCIQADRGAAAQPSGPVGFGSVPPPLRTITMTKEQADSAKEFLGVVLKSWAVKSDPRLAMGPSQPATFDPAGCWRRIGPS